jgi:membrane protein DedA with SNARE-associated domain
MHELLSFISNYGLFAMFLLIFAEYACFPVSSEIILPFAGAFSASYGISFFLLLPLSVAAGLIGTSLCFFLGRKGGKFFLSKLSNRFPKTKKPLEASYVSFEKYGVFAVGIGRLIPLCRTYIAFIAGAFGQSYSTFFAASVVGISIWNFVLIGIGYFFRENWNKISGYYEQYRDSILLVLIVLLLLFLLHRIAKSYI